MPGELKQNLDSIPKGVTSEEQYEKLRKLYYEQLYFY